VLVKEVTNFVEDIWGYSPGWSVPHLNLI